MVSTSFAFLDADTDGKVARNSTLYYGIYRLFFENVSSQKAYRTFRSNSGLIAAVLYCNAAFIWELSQHLRVPQSIALGNLPALTDLNYIHRRGVPRVQVFERYALTQAALVRRCRCM